MAKIFAVTIILIAIASAIPIVAHMWPMPQDISTHGHLIDDQYADTMLEAGISFLASQFLLAFFIWKFSSPKPGEKVKSFPGGATGMVPSGAAAGTSITSLSGGSAAPYRTMLVPSPQPFVDRAM